MSPSGCYRVKDQTIDLARIYSSVRYRLSQGEDAVRAHSVLGSAIPTPSGWRMADTYGRYLAFVFPASQSLGRSVHGSWSMFCRHCELLQ